MQQVTLKVLRWEERERGKVFGLKSPLLGCRRAINVD